MGLNLRRGVLVWSFISVLGINCASAEPLMWSVATISLFYAAQTAGQTLAQRELLPVGVTPWATMALFAVLPILPLRFRPR